MRDATVRTAPTGTHRQDVHIAQHHLTADEPVESGGDDAGPAPHDFLLAALGACTSITLKLYATRKGWPLTACEVHLSQHKEADGRHVITRDIQLVGELDEEQRTRLLEIANKCPVHKTLTGEIEIQSKLAP